jgi:AcrR family transcriptional regulator
MARPKKSILTRDKVIAGAIALIGQGGLEAFTMPKLASALGVRAPSLYHYITDKEALLSAVAREVATPGPMPALPADADWTDYLISQSVAMRRSVIAHPHCAPLLVRFMPRDNMFAEYEQMCGFLSAFGVPSALHVRIIDGMTALTIGAAVLNENAAHYTDSGEGPTPDPNSHPALRAALEAIGDASPDELFESYLRTYLHGILAEIRDLTTRTAAPRRKPKQPRSKAPSPTG